MDRHRHGPGAARHVAGFGGAVRADCRGRRRDRRRERALDRGEPGLTAGGDIWDCYDNFEFAYSRLSGDFDVSLAFTAREHSTGCGRWGKFGLMARQSLDASSRYTFIHDQGPDLQDPCRVARRVTHLAVATCDEARGILAGLGVAAHVIVTGYVSDPELIWLYRNCCANLYPSLFEGFGLPVLEGMQFGAPTLASNSSSIPEVAGDAAILLPPEQVHEWTVDVVEDMNLKYSEGMLWKATQ